jgi:hypothetical protein
VHSLKNVPPQANSENIKFKYENLIRFTYTSCFLPATGKRFRALVVMLYADYLLSVGDETAKALNIYVQAFLQSPKDSRFRRPLLSILNQGRKLTSDEMDLLLVMVQQGGIRDTALTYYLASLFLNSEQWSGKVELLFLSALEDQVDLSAKIIQFALPIYLAHKRTDERALQFYLFALNYSVIEEDEIKNYISRSFCDGNLSVVAPELHQKCGKIYASLSSDRQTEIKKQSEQNRIASKLKSIKIFRREDLQDLKRLKIKVGLVSGRIKILEKGASWITKIILRGCKWIVFQILESLIKFGFLTLKAKIIIFSVFSILIMMVLVFSGLVLKHQNNSSLALLSSMPISKSSQEMEDRVFTVQIAAVISSKQAEAMILRLKKKGIKGLYVVKAVQRAGGYWYKIRAGQFSSKDQASAYANRLVDSKLIKNYFVISLPKI